MQYTEDQLGEIEKYAEALVTLHDIAILVDVDDQTLREDTFTKGHPAYAAYHRGKLRTVVTLKAAEIELAKKGSPQAIENAVRFLKEMNVDEI